MYIKTTKKQPKVAIKKYKKHYFKNLVLLYAVGGACVLFGKVDLYTGKPEEN